MLAVSLRAGGTGLNLVRANHVIHFDRWWNPAVEDQASDRVWRIGQTRGVVVHTLVCPGTIEERIAAIIEAKRALAGSDHHVDRAADHRARRRRARVVRAPRHCRRDGERLMTEPEGESLPDEAPTFDSARQAELARILEQLDTRPPIDRAEVFARASRTLAPPPTVVTIFAETDSDAGRDDTPKPES